MISKIFLMFLTSFYGLNVYSAIINVTTFEDNVAGSLREAISIANSNGEDDVIKLPAGTYVLTGNSGEDGNSSGDLDINTDKTITIAGEGAKTTIIDGNKLDRVLHILKGEVLLSGITIQNGKAGDGNENPSNGEHGGAILNDGNLHISNCSIKNSQAGHGSDNVLGAGGDGGGIYNNGSLTITNTNITGNKSGWGGFLIDYFGPDGDGGGIYNSSTLSINGGNVNNNRSRAGGGIYNNDSGAMALSGCTLNKNSTRSSTYSNGGGICNKGTASISNCSVGENKTGNAATMSPEEFYPAGKGGGIYNVAILYLERCLIYNNYTGDGSSYGGIPAGDGGGIFHTGEKLYLANSTITENHTGKGYEGSSGNGGGIFHEGQDATIINCTITGNYIGSSGTNEAKNLGHGGGINGQGINVKNTIIANNQVNVKEKGPDCYGTINSLGYNLVKNVMGCTIGGDLTGLLTGQDPTLGSLENNGGSTMTQALLPGSPAIDAGNSPNIFIDQRGFGRPVDIPGIINSGDGSDIGAFEYQHSSAAILFVSRSKLNFGGDTVGKKTEAQSFIISNKGGGTLQWTLNSAVAWISINPTNGSNTSIVAVSANPTGLAVGTHTGTITASDPNASNSPQTVAVTLTVYSSNQTSVPFGEFATPSNDSNVFSSIPVTGWVLDDINVLSVKIYNGDSFVGDAVFVEGARPDVEQAYPDYPNNHRAGWGYMMLTNFLPNGGNGTYTLLAKATDVEGHKVILGSKTIKIDNANAVKPFGAIDTPTQGGTSSGTSFVNWGWVLTPLPNSIPTDGSTINVWVDGVNMGNPSYNLYRSDIATNFPGYTNSNGAVGYFYLDTTAHENGVHTIQWTATDNVGNTDGIGSRYFTIQNTDSEVKAAIVNGEYANIPVDNTSVFVKRGFMEDSFEKPIKADDSGECIIKIRELEPVQIKLLDGLKIITCRQMVGNSSRKKPVGMSTNKNVIHWMPGIAYVGNYPIRVVIMNQHGELFKKILNIFIEPKFGPKG